MARIGYARVSTIGQNLDMQITALENSNCDRIFVEKVSGVKERPELQAALKYMRAGDTFIVYKFDRIGRSLKDNEPPRESMRNASSCVGLNISQHTQC